MDAIGMTTMFNPADYDPALLLEQNILGCILLEPGLISEAKDRLQGEMFSHSYHRKLFRMLFTMHNDGQALDMVTIVTRYENHMNEVGGVTYLAGLVGSVYSSSRFREYTDLLVESDARRRLLLHLEASHRKFSDPANGTFAEMLDAFEQETLAIRPKTSRLTNSIESVIDWYEQLVEQRANPGSALGLLTGWDELDRMMLGLQRTDFIVVGARTSIGKSVFALELANRVNERGYKVAFFSLEMTKKQVYNRLASNIVKVPMQAMRSASMSDGQLSGISNALNMIAKIHIDDERMVTAEYITSEMRRLKRENGLDLVIVDYLQEIKEPSEKNDNSGSALHRICQTIRKAAQECNCAVVGLSQVKREVEQRVDKRPFVSDLSGSGALEAVADAIILLYRDDYYNKESGAKGIIEVDLAKQRNGPTGVVKLRFDKDYQRIG